MLEIVAEIYDKAKMIYDLAQTVKANKAQCTKLAERASQITSSVRDLDASGKIPTNARYLGTLDALKACLQDCHNFITAFSSQGWFKRVVKSSSNKDEFASLNQQLLDLLPQLNVGISAEILFNHSDDEAAAHADRLDIMARQDEILDMNNKILAEVQAARMDGPDLAAILDKQMASLREHIAQMMTPMEAKAEAAPLIDPHHTAEFHEIIMQRKLGHGSFGAVYQANYQTQKVAVKMLDSLTAADQAEFVREVKIMSRLHSPHITQFYAACIEPGRACLVMEYMENGCLSSYMQKRRLSYDEKRDITLQLARGLVYLHSRGVVHADVKSENILVNSHGEAKWTDFGLSKTSASSVVSIGKSSQAINWQAPEAWRSRAGQTTAADVYSFGLVMWAIWTGKALPYEDLGSDDSVAAEVGSGYREAIPSEVPPEYAEWIQRCWAVNPDERPTMEEVVKAIEAASRPPSPAVEELMATAAASIKLNDYNAAREHLARAADKGTSKALTQLGMFSLTGRGEPIDKRKAYDYFYRAATATPPHPRAAYNLAEMLKWGDGVDKNLDEALHWYREAVRLNPDDTKAAHKAAQLEAEIGAAAGAGGGAGAAPGRS